MNGDQPYPVKLTSAYIKARRENEQEIDALCEARDTWKTLAKIADALPSFQSIFIDVKKAYDNYAKIRDSILDKMEREDEE